MDDHSVMLEHTLVLAGEVVDSGMVWQVNIKQHPIYSVIHLPLFLPIIFFLHIFQFIITLLWQSVQYRVHIDQIIVSHLIH
jgi:hypothetical protein